MRNLISKRSNFHFKIFALILASFSSPAISSESPLTEPDFEKIKILSDHGNEFMEAGSYEEASIRFKQALKYVPEPWEEWEAATWLIGSIGDAEFSAGNFETAKTVLLDAMACPNAIGNPFLHLRLGQSQYELGNKERAIDELARAYMGAGKEIFATENPKYFNYVKSVLKPPPNGQW